ncbi:hypothetical protein KP78_05630 [Jeotgalibacillus soli]|uniref:Uncharacterized protein n=1 Tax=Jeotgalibacillus soli TaxID=889306 RepID=A0A0C2SE10_9BACL|nr:hypothetical protein KP78_05630 [Jeotgalibacillus soli]
MTEFYFLGRVRPFIQHKDNDEKLSQSSRDNSCVYEIDDSQYKGE